MRAEYLIWGTPIYGGDEVLLVSELAGITNERHAANVVQYLLSQGFKNVRVQRIELSGDVNELSNDFKNSINLNR